MNNQASPLKPQKKRMVEQDIAKAICILSVLVCHIVSLTREMSFVFFQICGPAMIFFFMISGYNYKPGKDSYWKTIKKRFMQLVLPMFVYFVVIFLIMGIYLYIRGEIKLSDIGASIADVWINNCVNTFFGITPTKLSVLMAPAWFLKYMMSGFVIFYAVVPWAMSKMSRFYSTCAGLVLVAGIFAHFEIALPWGLHTAPAVACFMLIGAMLGRSGVFTDEGQTPKWRVINALVAFAITFALGYVFGFAGYMAGGDLTGKYGEAEIILAIIHGILGTGWLLALGRLIAKVKILSKFMVFVGQHTFSILLVHVPLSRFIFRFFALPTPSITPTEFNPITILVCIVTLAIQCLAIFAIEQIKKRMQAKKNEVQSMAA